VSGESWEKAGRGWSEGRWLVVGEKFFNNSIVQALVLVVVVVVEEEVVVVVVVVVVAFSFSLVS
jgi:hypothetical protein